MTYRVGPGVTGVADLIYYFFYFFKKNNVSGDKVEITPRNPRNPGSKVVYFYKWDANLGIYVLL